MTDFPPLALLRTQQASELCSHFEASPAAQELLASFPVANSFLESLIAHQLWRDAVQLLAYGLQKRAAVWWACAVCRRQLQQMQQPVAPSREFTAIDCTEQWVRDPQERYRLAACNAAMAAGNRSPAHWAAMAAFWASGNMTPDSGVFTAPPPFLYAHAVVATVEFAAARCGSQRDAFFRDAVRRGISLVSGGDGIQGL